MNKNTPPPTQEQIDRLTKLANEENASAQFNLGIAYENGWGVKQELTEEERFKKAVEWYEKSAEQENASAQFNLGGMYNNGNGVKQSYEKAVYWWEKSAEQGYADAQFNLGVCIKLVKVLNRVTKKRLNGMKNPQTKEMRMHNITLGLCM